ncbi:hypothetical protein [Moraxella nasicaprae]|uniref:Uncharacterized protein n=1 Tax=Moraxella nasicaprae TaxID=2904122 RepID=A0ABY6F5M0_9GAMM|nr:hypothetical protein [Moraxella nasicaprae]UXZ05385.1 hypothetical protein LU297_02750 [Moraxella nasicaprae]
MDKVIGIYSGKNLATFEEEGGIGYWIVQSGRVKNAKYVLVMRNHRESWSAKDDGFQHGQAYMLGKIAGCSSDTPYKGRKIILISEYVLLPQDNSTENVWKKLTNGQRYPVSYLNADEVLQKMGLDVNSPDLDWQPFMSKQSMTNHASKMEVDDKRDLVEIIAEAKEMIAYAADVDISAVEIKINF